MKQQHYSSLLYSKRLLLAAATALTVTMGTFTLTSSVNADDQVPVTVAQEPSQKTVTASDTQDVNTASSASTSSADVNSLNKGVQATAQQSVAGTNNTSAEGSSSTPKGQLVTDSNGKVSYYNDAGQRVAGTGNTASTLAYQYINGKTYAFNDKGVAYTGFLNGWNNLYYFGNDGARYTNQWYYNWGHYYYFGSNGARLTNQFLTSKQVPNNDGKGGVVNTNRDHVYYFNPKTGILAQNQFYNNWGNTYYFGSNGARYTNQFYKNWGNMYYFGDGGVRYTNRWYYNWGNYYYFGGNGARLTDNFLTSKQLPTNDGKGGIANTNQYHVYYFNPGTGIMARNQFYNNWGNTYYFGSNGARYTNQFYSNWGNMYYFGNEGARYTNRWYNNWGHRYFFGNGGVRATNTYFNALGAGGDYDTHWADNSGIVSDVHYFSQYTPVFAPWGCAGASLAMLLSIRNVYPNLYDLIHNEPNVYGSRNQGWAGGQSGNVVTGAGFDRVIQPNALSAYGREFFGGICDISYTNLFNIARVVQSGHPVLYYGWSAYDAGGNRNHCKIILGYNARNNSFHVYDPLYGYRGRWTAHSTGGNAYDLGYNAWVPAWHIQGEMSGQALSIY